MKKIISRTLLIIITLEGGIALGLIFRISQKISIPFSIFTVFYKTSALSLIGLVFAFSLIAFLLILLAYIRWEEYQKIQQKIIDFAVNKRNSTLIITFSLLVIYVAGQLVIQIQDLNSPLQVSFLMLTRPVWLWLILLCIETICLIFVLRSSGKIVINRDFLSILLIFSLLSLTWYGLTRLGVGFAVASDNINFDVVGNPILGYQVILAIFVIVFFFFLEKQALIYIKTHQWISPKYFDNLIAVFIFFGAILVWSQAPLNTNPFIDQPRPPNYEYYPASDALLYDRTAQSLIASGTLQTNLDPAKIDVGYRPAFTTMLAVFHAVGGVGYEDIIPLMTFVYALLPVLIFFFTNTIHNRTSGLLAAILMITRDLNGQLLEKFDAGVHSKMILAEILMIMGMVIFMILVLKWLKSEGECWRLLLLAGGVLGLTALVRSEILVMLPLVWLIYVLKKRYMSRDFLRSASLLGLGVILVISPWMIRNYYRTGEIYLDRPGQLGRLLNVLDGIIDGLDQDNISDSAGIPWDGSYQKTGSEIMNPAQKMVDINSAPHHLVVRIPLIDNNGEKKESRPLVLDHISNNFIQSILFLPSNPVMLNMHYLTSIINGKVTKYYDGFFYSSQKYVKGLPYWNLSWDGSIPERSVILLEINLALLSIGFLLVWKRSKPAFWITALTYLSFVLLFSYINQSGGRNIQKVDWIILIYFSIGIIEVFRIFAGGLDWKPAFSELPARDSKLTGMSITHKQYQYILPLVLLMGLAPPLAEIITPNRYPEAAVDQQVETLLENQPGLLSEEDIRTLKAIGAGGGEWVWGRALYPRQLYSGDTSTDTNPSVYSGMKRTHFSRFEFFLTGSKNVWVVLNRENSPEFFPHGSSVLTIGCKKEGGFEALAVLIQNERDEVVDVHWRDGALEDYSGCPLSTP